MAGTLASMLISIGVDATAMVQGFASAVSSANAFSKSIEGVASVASKSFSGLGSTLNSTSSSIANIGNSMVSIGSTLNTTLTQPLINVGVQAIQAAGSLEKTKLAFATLIGSAQEANAYIQDMFDFAEKTPFQFGGLMEASKRMMAYGFEVDETQGMLETLGDAMAGLGGGDEGILRAARAFGQMRAAGTVMKEDLNQLTDLGVSTSQILQEKLGLTAKEIANIGKYQIESSTVIEALLEGMTEKFGGLMDEQSRTLLGMWSNLKDASNRALAEIGESLTDALDLKGIIETAIGYVKSLSDAFIDLPDSVKGNIVMLGVFVAAIGPAFIIVGQMAVALSGLIAVFAFLVSPLGILVAAIAAFGVAMIKAALESESLLKGITDMLPGFAGLWEIVWEGLGKVAEGVMSALAGDWDAAAEQLLSGFAVLKEALGYLWNATWRALKPIVMKVVSDIQSWLVGKFDEIESYVSMVMDDIINSIAKFTGFSPDTVATILKVVAAMAAMAAIGPTLYAAIAPLIPLFTGVLGVIKYIGLAIVGLLGWPATIAIAIAALAAFVAYQLGYKEEVLAIWTSIKTGVLKIWDTLYRAVESIASETYKTVMFWWNKILDAAYLIGGDTGDAWYAAWLFVSNTAQVVWDEIVSIITRGIDLVTAIINVGLALLRGDWGSFWKYLKDAAFAIWGAITDLVDNFFKLFGRSLDGVSKSISEFLDFSVLVIKLGAVTIGGFIKGILGDLKNLVVSAFGEYGKYVEFVIDKVIAGIKSAVDAASKWVGSLIDELMEALGLTEKLNKAPRDPYQPLGPMTRPNSGLNLSIDPEFDMPQGSPSSSGNAADMAVTPVLEAFKNLEPLVKLTSDLFGPLATTTKSLIGVFSGTNNPHDDKDTSSPGSVASLQDFVAKHTAIVSKMEQNVSNFDKEVLDAANSTSALGDNAKELAFAFGISEAEAKEMIAADNAAQAAQEQLADAEWVGAMESIEANNARVQSEVAAADALGKSFSELSFTVESTYETFGDAVKQIVGSFSANVSALFPYLKDAQKQFNETNQALLNMQRGANAAFSFYVLRNQQESVLNNMKAQEMREMEKILSGEKSIGEGLRNHANFNFKTFDMQRELEYKKLALQVGEIEALRQKVEDQKKQNELMKQLMSNPVYMGLLKELKNLEGESSSLASAMDAAATSTTQRNLEEAMSQTESLQKTQSSVDGFVSGVNTATNSMRTAHETRTWIDNRLVISGGNLASSFDSASTGIRTSGQYLSDGLTAVTEQQTAVWMNVWDANGRLVSQVDAAAMGMHYFKESTLGAVAATQTAAQAQTDSAKQIQAYTGFVMSNIRDAAAGTFGSINPAGSIPTPPMPNPNNQNPSNPTYIIQADGQNLFKFMQSQAVSNSTSNVATF